MRLALLRRPCRFAFTLCTTSALLLLGGGIAVTALPFSAAEPAAQKGKTQDYALIIGTVWGPDNRPVAGIPVKIRRSTDKRFKWELVSDSRGEFAQRVPPGTQDYVIQADIKAPKGQPKPEITVHIADNEREDVGLHLTELPPKK